MFYRRVIKTDTKHKSSSSDDDNLKLSKPVAFTQTVDQFRNIQVIRFNTFITYVTTCSLLFIYLFTFGLILAINKTNPKENKTTET